jgi:hypothetical protein
LGGGFFLYWKGETGSQRFGFWTCHNKIGSTGIGDFLETGRLPGDLQLLWQCSLRWHP